MLRRDRKLSRRTFASRASAIVGIVVLFVGCTTEGPELHSFSGRLTHQGTPIPKMTVVFLPENLSQYRDATATTDEEGYFDMKYASFSGVAPGVNRVYVQDPIGVHGDSTSDDPAYQAVLKKYGKPENAMKIDVTQNESNYELKLD